MKILFMIFLGASFLLPLDTFAQKVDGKEIFTTKCAACHTYGQGDRIGPDLKGVTQRRKADWIKKMIKSPDTMVKSDPVAKELLKKYNNIAMTNFGLKDAEVDAVVSYLKNEDSKK